MTYVDTIRLVLASLVYVLDTVALVSAVALLEMDWQRWVMVGGIVAGGLAAFSALSLAGRELLERHEDKERRRPLLGGGGGLAALD